MIAFYPGSFDPITRGHVDIIARTLHFAPQLVVGVGNNGAKTTLFNAVERVDLITATLKETLSREQLARVTVKSYAGATVDFAQKIGANIIIKGLRGAADYAYEEKMAIVNHRLAPEIDSVFLFTDNALRDVSSSIVKEMAGAGIPSEKFDHYLTPAARDALLMRVRKVTA
jgi:pantetheine-phosphate adenylyltransferase